MAATILPHANLFNLASGLETEAAQLKAGIELMNMALQFSYADSEQAGQAQGQMFYLVDTLSNMQQRLAALSATAYALSRAEKTMA